MDDLLILNNDNDNDNDNEKEYYILSKENIKLDVFLIENKNDETFSKYLMINCKKEEIENFEKLEIYCYNNPLFENEIQLNKQERKIIEINKNNKILTFVSIFNDESINNEDFNDSKDFDDYKDHFDELICEEKNVNKNRKIIFIVLIAVSIVILFSFLITIILVSIYNNKDNNNIIIEEEDDLHLKKYIYIRDMSNSINDGIKSTLCYKNHYLKYIGYFKNFEANGEGIYYSKDYNKTIIYEGNFENGFPYGIGKMHYYEGNKETGYYKGSWDYGKKSGKGEMHYSNGDYYKGDFKNDQRHGQGKVYNSKNEIRCEGSFIDDIYQKSLWEEVKDIFTSKPHCY